MRNVNSLNQEFFCFQPVKNARERVWEIFHPDIFPRQGGRKHHLRIVLSALFIHLHENLIQNLKNCQNSSSSEELAATTLELAPRSSYPLNSFGVVDSKFAVEVSPSPSTASSNLRLTSRNKDVRMELDLEVSHLRCSGVIEGIWEGTKANLARNIHVQGRNNV